MIKEKITIISEIIGVFEQRLIFGANGIADERAIICGTSRGGAW